MFLPYTFFLSCPFWLRLGRAVSFVAEFVESKKNFSHKEHKEHKVKRGGFGWHLGPLQDQPRIEARRKDNRG